MNIHMAAVRTTLVLDRKRLIELKKLAAAQERTLSSLVDELLRDGIARQQNPRKPSLRKLPSFHMGSPRVNLADRDRLLDVMDG